jgi:hypothetical protein|tara:strand:- start:124 stop:339 length:216 start_codon:yes stop_codon:yes gene_type:complete
MDEKEYDFIDMIETKQGWIQSHLETLFDLISNNEEIEFLDNPCEILRFGIKEIEKIKQRLLLKVRFIESNI